MKLEQLLKIKEQQGEFTYYDFHEYIKTKGLQNISSSDLNQLIEEYGQGVLMMPGFNEYYGIVSSNESNKVMIRWTIAIGVMTVIVVLATLYMIFK